jgi:small ligand-binding sensory domain FIST
MFKLAHARGGDWSAATEDCLSQLRGQENTASLGFVFVTDHLTANFTDIVSALQSQTGVPYWSGTVGIGICATGIEYVDEPAMVVMLADLPVDSFHLFDSLGAIGDSEAQLTAKDINTAVVYGSPENQQLHEQVDQLAAMTQTGFVVGGVASSRSGVILYPAILGETGIAGVAFSNKVAMASRLTQGCTPIGEPHRVTACDHNIVRTLDHKPALQVMQEEMGELLSRDLPRASGQIFAGLPVSGSDTGEYMVRNLMGIDQENGLIAVGDMMTEGQSFMFCRRDAASARTDLERMATELRNSLDTPARGGLYFSCLGRGESLFGRRNEEMQIIRDILGDIPLAGFFANGEISHNRLYGYTGVLSLFV